MTTATWQLQDAKNKFSQVVNHALADGPQIVTRRGQRTAVILAYEEFLKLKHPQSRSIANALLSSPLIDDELDTTISNDSWREIEL